MYCRLDCEVCTNGLIEFLVNPEDGRLYFECEECMIGYSEVVDGRLSGQMGIEPATTWDSRPATLQEIHDAGYPHLVRELVNPLRRERRAGATAGRTDVEQPGWWTRDGAGLHVLPRDAPVPAAVALPSGGSLFCARMRGGAMADTDAVFTQFYEHLRLPDHFGWNWNALNDCLHDLRWIGARHVLVVIDEAERLLDGDPDGLRLLLGTLRGATAYWSSRPAVPWRDRTSLSAVLLAAPGACEPLERAAAAAC